MDFVRRFLTIYLVKLGMFHKNWMKAELPGISKMEPKLRLLPSRIVEIPKRKYNVLCGNPFDVIQSRQAAFHGNFASPWKCAHGISRSGGRSSTRCLTLRST